MCWYKATSRKGCHFIEQTFLLNKCSLAMSMFMQVLACSTIQYCDESFNGAEVMCRSLFRERVHFLQNTQLQLESLPTVFQKQGERVFYCNLWVNEKSKTIWFHSKIAGDFCQPRSSSTHNCCTTGMTRTTTSVSTAQLLIFLLGLLAASVARANILVSASSCKQGANEGISQAGHT